MTRPIGSEKIYAGGCYSLYSPVGFNNVCVGVGCDIRFTRGDHTHVEITLCDKCFKAYRTEGKTKRQREEAECNECVEIVFRRMLK